MISRIHGKLIRITDQFALIENGGVSYEVMLPSGLAERLKDSGKVGETISLDTIYYIEAGEKRSNFYPKLVGFTDPVDREFFSLLGGVESHAKFTFQFFLPNIFVQSFRAKSQLQ